MAIIHVNDVIFKNTVPEKIAKNTSPSNKEFNTILKTSTENRSKLNQQAQKPPINFIPKTRFNTFRPEETKPVGKVLLVRGNAMILKRDLKHTYQAKKGLPIFDGDTIVTREKGQMRIKFNDESITTLAPGSKLEINSSVYDSKKKIRSSSLTLMLGKARFLVKKLLHFKRSKFEVKTSRAVCGVRGSDFVVRVTPKVTEVTTFEDTKIEVMGLAATGTRPVILESLERIVIEEGSLPSKVEKITPFEVDKMKKELTGIPRNSSAAW
jgi:hypothetical protein